MNDLTAKVSDQMEKAGDKIKAQMDQMNESLSQLACASKGLIVKISETGSKQFNEFVKAGEGKTFTAEIKNALPKIADAKTSIQQLKSATIGLISKSKEIGSRYFNELVKQGEKQAHLTTKSININASVSTTSRPKTKTAA
jgi:hypothetical protein